MTKNRTSHLALRSLLAVLAIVAAFTGSYMARAQGFGPPVPVCEVLHTMDLPCDMFHTVTCPSGCTKYVPALNQTRSGCAVSGLQDGEFCCQWIEERFYCGSGPCAACPTTYQWHPISYSFVRWGWCCEPFGSADGSYVCKPCTNEP